MEHLISFLSNLRGDVFKLLPMREGEESGEELFLGEYLDSLIINIVGAMCTFPILIENKKYIYVVNNLQYLAKNETEMPVWRKIVLGATRDIDDLTKMFETEAHNE